MIAIDNVFTGYRDNDILISKDKENKGTGIAFLTPLKGTLLFGLGVDGALAGITV